MPNAALEPLKEKRMEKKFDQADLQQRHLGIQVLDVTDVTFSRIDLDFFANTKGSNVATHVKVKFHHSNPDRTIITTRKQQRQNKKTGEQFTKTTTHQVPHELCVKLISVRAMDKLRDLVRDNKYDKNNAAYVESVRTYKDVKKQLQEMDDTTAVVSMSTLKTTNFIECEAGESNKSIENTCLVVVQMEDGSISAQLMLSGVIFEFTGQVRKDIVRNCVANLKYNLNNSDKDDSEGEW
jgi:hypothetical protein